MLGLLLSVLIGPVFFTLLQTSIQDGFKNAIRVALGVSLGDILYIGLAYLGFGIILEKLELQEYLAFGGGLILMLFGVVNLIKKPGVQTSSVNKKKRVHRFVLRGFLVNGLSPFVLVFWLGTMRLASVEYGYVGHQLLLFFLAVIVAVFSMDCLKAYLAHKLSAVLTNRLMKVVNVVVGITLILFGIRMLFYFS